MRIAQYPTAEQIQQLLTGAADIPVVMVDLLRFKDRAHAPDEALAGVEIVNDPRVREIGTHRAAGLEGQWLIATTEGPI